MPTRSNMRSNAANLNVYNALPIVARFYFSF